jgi:hypothetical protein
MVTSFITIILPLLLLFKIVIWADTSALEWRKQIKNQLNLRI